MQTVPIDSIIVADRCRKDLGDVRALADSIKAVGLLHLPVVTGDRKLVAGERRLAAMRLLGWTETPVHEVATLAEAADLLRAERDENTCRKDLSPSEAVAIGERIESVLRPQAEARKFDGQVAGGHARQGSLVATFHQAKRDGFGNPLPDPTQQPTPQSAPPKTRDAVGASVGMSGKTYEKAKAVVEAARAEPEKYEPLVEQMDTSGKVDRAFKTLRAEQRRDADERLAAETDAAQPGDRARSVQPGEWWALGDHRLFCGDSTSVEFVNAVDQAAFAFADPPYGADAAEWDEAFVWDHDWLSDRAAVVAVTPGVVNVFRFAKLTAMPYRWTFTCWINNGMTRGDMGFGNTILVPLFSHGSIYRNTQDFMQVSISVAETSQTDHRGRKPTGLVARLMELYSEQGQTVIDPFLGSGTTLLVAEKLGRACIGAEIVPEFCSQIIARWEALTGQIAEVVP